MVLPSNSRNHAGCGDQGGGGVQWYAAEHGGTVHIHQAHRVPLPGGGETPRGKVIKEVVRETSTMDFGSSGGQGYRYGGYRRVRGGRGLGGDETHMEKVKISTK